MSAVIMVVEDDPIPAAIFTQALEQCGYGVQYAPDAETAIDMIAAGPPNLLVLDLILPGIDGVELLRQLREDPRTREIRVLLTTGGGGGLRRAAAAAAQRTPHTWFVEKGAPIEHFLMVIATALQPTPA